MLFNFSRVVMFWITFAVLSACRASEPFREPVNGSPANESQLANWGAPDGRHSKVAILNSSHFCHEPRNVNLANSLILATISQAVYNGAFAGIDVALDLGFGTRAEAFALGRVGTLFGIANQYERYLEDEAQNLTSDMPGGESAWSLAGKTRIQGASLQDRFKRYHGGNSSEAEAQVRKFVGKWIARTEAKEPSFRERIRSLPQFAREVLTSPGRLRGKIGFYWNEIRHGNILDAVKQKTVPVEGGECNVAVASNQAVWIENEDMAVLAIAGTDGGTDIATDLFAIPAPIDSYDGREVRIHSGFSCAAKDIWTNFLQPRLERFDRGTAKGKPLYLTGHSLGGSIASILGYFMMKDPEYRSLAGIYTFGAPRAGNTAYKRHIEALASGRQVVMPRFRNADDPVTRVPYGHELQLKKFWKSRDRYHHAGTLLHIRDEIFGKEYDFANEAETGDFSRSWINGKSTMRAKHPTITHYAEGAETRQWLDFSSQPIRKLSRRVHLEEIKKIITSLIRKESAHRSFRYYGRLRWTYESWAQRNPNLKSKSAVCQALGADLPFSL